MTGTYGPRARGRFSALLFLWLALTAGAAVADTPPGGLVLQEVPPILIDQSSSASLTLHLRNTGAAPVKIALHAEDFLSRTTGKRLGARFLFAGVSDLVGRAVYTPAPDLAPGATLFIKLDIVNVWEAGESTADLYNDGVKIGTLRAVKDRFPFNVKLSGATQERPELTFHSGEERVIVLKNDDPMTYPVSWDLVVGNKTVSGETDLPPSGAAGIKVNPPPGWFSDDLRSFFKPAAQDGELILRYRQPLGGTELFPPQRAIPVRAQLYYRSASWQEMLNFGVVFFVLFAGGFLSLIVRTWIPNQARRQELRGRLGRLAEKTREISLLCDSALRVMIRVERNRLAELLETYFVIVPGMRNIFTQIEAGISALDKRVDLIEKIDTVYAQLAELRASSPPPTLVREATDKLRKAAALLMNTVVEDADYQATEAYVREARRVLGSIREPDEAFAKALSARARGLRLFLGDGGELSATATHQRVQERLPGLFKALKEKYTDPANVSAENYVWLDESLTALGLVRDYILFHEGGSSERFRRSVGDVEAQLLSFLERPTLSSLDDAELILAEAKQGIGVEDLMKEASADPRRVSVHVDPQTVRTHQPAFWAVRFRDPKYNAAAAVRRISCKWEFGDGLEEEGWAVRHYYVRATPRRGQPYTVKVSLTPSGADPQSAATVVLERQITVSSVGGDRRWERSLHEIFYLVIILFIALISLMAGARDQLLKLDVIPGLIAILLLGFSVDAIKSLITQRLGDV